MEKEAKNLVRLHAIMKKTPGDYNHRNENSAEPASMRAAISTLPRRGWVAAALLAVPPAIGFYFLIRALTVRAEPSFIVFYWLAATYVLLRRTHLLRQVYLRTCLLIGLEALGLLAAKLLV
jgi:hypothetical protein